MIRYGKAVLLTAVMSMATASSTASQRPDEPRPGVIEITTSLVPLDVVVTDSGGRSIAGLTREDFQVLQDGKAQPITTFSMISAGPKVSPISTVTVARALSRDEVRRTIAFVVDDFTVGSSRNLVPLSKVRVALREFFERESREGDLMALLSLGKHEGGFEQFTVDRELLKALTKRLEFNPIQLIMEAGAGVSENIGEIRFTTLRSLVDGMKGMPGRKSIVLFSTGLPDTLPFRQLIEAANRVGVAIYVIDPRDPPTPGEWHQPNVNLATLAVETGGRFWGAQVDLGDSLAGVMNDQDSYYLLGYNPGQGTFDRRFHKIEVKVLRPGLRVRSRRGFDGEADNLQPEPKEPAAILSRLIQSPYRNTSLHAKLSPLLSVADGAPSLRSIVFIDGQDLQADRAADGAYRGSIEMLVAIVDPKGEISGQVARGFRFSLDAEGWRRARATGLAYTVHHPVSKPGPYQVRLALRDSVSGETGSTSAFLNVPDIKKEPLSLSGVLLSSPSTEGNLYPLSTPAARVFVQGREAVWTMEAYHSRANPKLQAAVRVLREGQPVREIPFNSVTAKKLGKGSALEGSFQIGKDWVPGDYFLQLMVRDENDKKREISQFTDFRVIATPGPVE